jgi:hypothetical protein
MFNFDEMKKNMDLDFSTTSIFFLLILESRMKIIYFLMTLCVDWHTAGWNDKL